MSGLRAYSLFGRAIALDPRARAHDRDGRRLAELEPAQLLRHEVPAEQRLSRDPGQSRHCRRDPARRDRLRLAARHSRAGRHGRRVPRGARDAGDRRRRDRDRRQGGVDAARHPQRRGRGNGRGGGDRGRHEPLPEDRVRPARRRIVVERGQQRHHQKPPARAAARPPDQGRGAGAPRTTSSTVSRPARSMPAPHPTRPPGRARRRSTRPRLMFSTMSTTPPRSSTCTISATSTRG